MPTTEAQEIYEQAMAFVDDLNGRKTKDRRLWGDAAAMLKVAIDRAGGPFPDAETQLASVYLFGLYNELMAQEYADRALKTDPNHFLAQTVKLDLAIIKLPGFFANSKFKSELQRLLLIYENRCKSDSSAESFIDRTDLLMRLADVAAGKSASVRSVFTSIANVSIDHLEYDNDEQRAEVKRLRIVAQGRS